MLPAEERKPLITLREVYRYLGTREEDAPVSLQTLVADCVCEVREKSQLRACVRRFPVRLYPEGVVNLGEVSWKSLQLARNLSGCDAAYLFGATIGPGADFLLQKANALGDMTRAAVLQAVGAAFIEDYCDRLNEDLRQAAAEKGEALCPRFSPGYGDLSLEVQTDVFRLLDLSRQTGISLGENLLMMPSKSVTAVIGLKRI